MKLAYAIAVAAVWWLPSGAASQEPSDITGRWQAETPEGPQLVIVRSDSTASFGEETVRWRLTADTVFILFGDEWVGYNFLLDGDSLTLSGGDLEEPIALKRINPAPGGGGRPEWDDRFVDCPRGTRS